MMTPQEAVAKKILSTATPDKCYACKHSYNDIEEGWNCTKFDAEIRLADGSMLAWPGQNASRAYYTACRGGEGFERSLWPGIVCKYPIVSIGIGALVFSTVMVLLTC